MLAIFTHFASLSKDASVLGFWILQKLWYMTEEFLFIRSSLNYIEYSSINYDMKKIGELIFRRHVVQMELS